MFAYAAILTGRQSQGDFSMIIAGIGPQAHSVLFSLRIRMESWLVWLSGLCAGL